MLIYKFLVSCFKYLMSFEHQRYSPEASRAESEIISPHIEFLVTDHSTRYPERFSPEELKELYSEMKHHGISSIRFDMDWNKMAKASGEWDRETIDRYVETLKIVEKVGMKPSTLVLSSPPEWAQQLYKKDKESYFRNYEEYMRTVAEAVSQAGTKIHSVQLFNEINNSFLFKFVDVADLPRCAAIVRDTIGKTQPGLKLATSLIVGNINDNVGRFTGAEDIENFLEKHGQMLKENFDVISVDYYPGVWHLPLGEEKSKISSLLGKGSAKTRIMQRVSSVEGAANPKHLNATFKNLEMLKKTFERIAKLGIDYEIGETGFPTNVPYSTEDRQRYFYDSFFRAFRQLLVDFASRDIPLPKRVDLYETQDEENTGFGGITDKLLKLPGVQKLTRLTPNPKHNFGLKKKSGEAKSILRGRRYSKDETLDAGDLSQLQKIILYTNRPIEISPRAHLNKS